MALIVIVRRTTHVGYCSAETVQAGPSNDFILGSQNRRKRSCARKQYTFVRKLGRLGKGHGDDLIAVQLVRKDTDVGKSVWP
jgi:hypothetical protein